MRCGKLQQHTMQTLASAVVLRGMGSSHIGTRTAPTSRFPWEGIMQKIYIYSRYTQAPGPPDGLPVER